MTLAARAALALVLLAALLGAGCGSLKPGKKGTLSCSCGGTGCGCKHCTGEQAGCSCTATDAYPSNRVGEAGD